MSYPTGPPPGPMEQPYPTYPPPGAPQPPPRVGGLDRNVKAIIGAVAAVGIVAALLVGNAKNPDPIGNDRPARELCDLLADPSNDMFTPGDWQDLAGFSSRGLLIQYVEDRCPSQLARVT